MHACLQAVGLYDVAELYAGELSGGMQKRVSFARALIDNLTVVQFRTGSLLGSMQPAEH